MTFGAIQRNASDRESRTAADRESRTAADRESRTAADRRLASQLSVYMGRATLLWGHTRRFLFPLADDRQTTVDSWDGTVTGAVSGDPQPVAPLADDEGGALELDGDDHVDYGDVDEMDVGSGEDFSVYATVQTSGSGTIISKRNSTPYWSLAVNSNGKAEFEVHDGSATTVSSTTSVDDGSTHTVVGALDRDGDLKIYVDGTLEGNTGASSVGDLSNSNSVRIGEDASGANTLTGTLQAVVFAQDWAADQMPAHYDAVRSDGSNAKEIKPQIPDYLYDRGLASDIVTYWDHDQFVRFSDGDGIEQLSSRRGNPPEQRTTSQQPIYRSNHIELGGDDASQATGFNKDPSGKTLIIFAVMEKVAGGFENIFEFKQDGGNTLINVRSRNNGDFETVVVDSSGTPIARGADVSIDTTQKFAFVTRVELGLSTLRVKNWCNDGSGELINGESQSTNGDFSGDTEGWFAQGDGSGSEWNGKAWIGGKILTDTAPSDSKMSGLLSDLVSRESIT